MSDGRVRLRLFVDYGYTWPLEDFMWPAEERPDWNALLPAELIARLEEWARFFTKHANEETGSFGTEDRRRWFDLEGVRLHNELLDRVGDQFDIRLELWF
ncbi:hypothetical protein [uncultured Agrococcus sp.]|uniref:hypothetical protein n=1 Tax=uncultured Agrococcus sp. TaxID=382258 RepID=UPI0025CE5239|nr:hypothetical protein [uncultured Agrococcus sp.]